MTDTLVFATLSVFFILQCYHKPFGYKYANFMEVICLGGLLMIVMAHFVDERNLQATIIAILISIPFVIIVLMLLKTTYSFVQVQLNKVNMNYDTKSKHIDRIVNRAPESFRTWLQNSIDLKNQDYNQVQLTEIHGTQKPKHDDGSMEIDRDMETANIPH
eukprot:406632_1